MDIAALILSIVALICSLACLVLMLAKNFFSTHQVQMVPLDDPFKDVIGEIGKKKLSEFAELDVNLSQEEIDEIRGRKPKIV